MSSPCLVAPFIPRDADGPVFSAPWEARAFALAVKLHEAGHFAWNEWASTLSAEIARSEHAGEGHADNYYECWVAALERLLARKQIVSADDLGSSMELTRRTWPHPDHVARREPIARSLPFSAV